MIFDWLTEYAVSYPERIAVEYGDITITYRELANKTLSISQPLEEFSFPAGSTVIVRLERSPELIAAMFGIWKAGLTYLPVSPNDPEFYFKNIIHSTQCVAVITSSLNNIDVDSFSLESKGTAPSFSNLSINLNCVNDLHSVPSIDPQYIIYTSGSTGNPKKVVVALSDLSKLISELSNSYRITSNDRVLQFAAPSFDTSIEPICVALAAGAALVLPDRLWAPSEFHEQIYQKNITVMDLTPNYWRESTVANSNCCFREIPIRLIIFGGSSLYNQDLRLARDLYPNARIINAYGLTETVITSCLSKVGSDDPLHDGPAAVGYQLPPTCVAVIDDAGDPCPCCEIGEIAINGQLAKELTSKVSIDGVPAYLTGDLGYFDTSGRLFVTGRKDRQFKIRGYRVDPYQIEQLLRNHESILDTAVINDIVNGELIAFYTIRSEYAHPDVTKLFDFIRYHLPSYAILSRLIFISNLTKTNHGKIDYKNFMEYANKSLIISRTKKKEVENKEIPLYAAVIEIWKLVLKIESAELDNNFFECGGTSITAAELIARTRSSLGIHISYVRSLMEHFLANPTLKRYCFAVEEARTGRLKSSGNQRKMQNIELSRDIALSTNTLLPTPLMISLIRILITGVTGFLGINFLQRILTKTSANITCLVRAKSEKHGFCRLSDAWKNYGSGENPFSGFEERINIIVGDLEQPELGLGNITFDLLSEKVDMIFHLGGKVNFIYPYSEIKAANVDGTFELLRLAARCGAAFHYVSTIAVIAGHGVAGAKRVSEYTPLEHLHELGVGYVESKWISEYLVKKSGKAGLPISIYRAADISGHSLTGTWNTAAEMCCMKKFIIDIGAFPDAELALDYTPVAVFSDAIIHIAFNEKTIGKVYHLTNPNKAHISLLAERISARGHQVKKVSWNDWVHKMINLAIHYPNHPMTPFAPLFIDRCPSGKISIAQMYLEDMFPQFSRDNVESALKGSEIIFPKVDNNMIDIYLDFLESRSFL